MYGWMGTILKVDLTSGKIKREPLSEEVARNYIGGRGINVRMLYDSVKPGTEPFSSDNVLIFGTGPLTGTALASGRLNITAVSAMNFMLGDANAGSHFSPELKYAGYDHVVFTGKSDRPVYLWIDDDTVELRDAKHLWGKLTDETNEMIKKETGDSRIQVSCIGPAGENLSRLACVIVGFDGAAGKCGLGAVMGSKNLKAVAVRGTKGVKVANPSGLRDYLLEVQQRAMRNPEYAALSTYGTTRRLAGRQAQGTLPIRNAYEGGFGYDKGRNYDNISPETLRRKYTIKDKACFGCVNHCRQWYEIKEGPYAGLRDVGMELVTQESFGTLFDNWYAPSVYKGMNLSNRYGLDMMECGQIIAAAAEWYERGLITKEDLGGIDLQWGNYEAQLAMIPKIANREGIGDLLAEGAVIAAKKIGPEAEKTITQYKGVFRSTVEVRAAIGYALGLATATRGADHLRGAVVFPAPADSYDGIAEAVFGLQRAQTMADSLEICKFVGAQAKMEIVPGVGAKFLSLVTGMEIDEEAMLNVVDRIWTLERAFIVREGVTRKDDFPVGRMMEEPIGSGPLKGRRLDRKKWEKMLDDYYRLNGFDKNGVPKRATLERLGLKEVADELESMGKLEKAK